MEGVKQKTQKIYKLRDLPPHLRQKYKHNELFAENRRPKEPFKFNAEALKQKKVEKQKTIQEKLDEFKLNPTEEKYLLAVFKELAAEHQGAYFTAHDIECVLKKMNMKLTKREIELMIWEIDEHLDQKITQRQFVNMYKKSVFDSSGIEPKKIFHFTQFLMYCKPQKYTITAQDTLQLLFVRLKPELKPKVGNHDKDCLDLQLQVIFGENHNSIDGIQREVTFKQYLDKINERAIKNRKEHLMNKGKVSQP